MSQFDDAEECLRLLSALRRPSVRGERFRLVAASESSNFSTPHGGEGMRFVGGVRPEKKRTVLGISAFYHDASAALVVDGELVATVQEDRFSRLNHDSRFPQRAIEFCLKQGGLSVADVDLVAYYEEPFLKADRILQTLFAASRDAREPLAGRLAAARRNLLLQSGLAASLGFEGPLCFVQHHLSHAASAFYLSPFERAACLVIDGVGEWATTTLSVADEHGIRVLEQIDYPHSLGLLYSALTAYLGFAVNNDEYKVMALASYGAAAREGAVHRLVRRFSDGSFALNLQHFSFHKGGGRMYEESFAELFDLPARPARKTVTAEHADVACSVQRELEEVVAGLMRRLHEITGLRHLVMAGGVALNGVANYKAFKSSPFEEIFVQPAAGDAGGSIGAALYAYHALNGPRKKTVPRFNPFLGPAATQGEVETFLRGEGIRYKHLSEDELVGAVARALHGGKVVGWFQGRMETGPRALGSRSILANPQLVGMRDLVNQKIKFRESFRPFAPALPEEEAGNYFDLCDRHSPLYYMLFVLPISATQAGRIPAVVHVDGTTRPQLVSEQMSPRFYALLRAFGRESGVPVLLNTSFNLAGEPIVCTPADAFKTFSYSDMDQLVIEHCLIDKEGD